MVMASGTDTVIAFGTELFDSSSAYDTSTYKFTPQVAGHYFSILVLGINQTTQHSKQIMYQYQKMDQVINGRNDNTDYSTVHVSGTIQLNGSTDYNCSIKSYQRIRKHYSNNKY